MQVKLAIAAMGVALAAGSAAAQPYYPYNPYWGPRWVAPYQPAPVYPPPAYYPPAYVPPPAYTPPAYVPPAVSYDHRALVDAIQDELEEHGYRPGPTEGLLDSETVGAIRDYQRDAGLPVTGEATPALLDHLRYTQPPVYARAGTPTYPSQPSYPGQPGYPGQPAYPGQSSYPAQPAYPAPSYDTPPVTAGPTDQPTYTTRPEPLVGPQYTTRPDGFRGDPDVAWVQSALQRRGYTPGPADGMMGERTRRAIEAFQRDNGMTPDGVVGPALLNRLR